MKNTNTAPSATVVIQLTENEVIILKSMCDSQYHDGRHPVDDLQWFENPFSSKKTASGTMVSLVKKGYAYQQDSGTEDHAVSITQEGFDALASLEPAFTAKFTNGAAEPVELVPEGKKSVEDRVRAVAGDSHDIKVIGEIVQNMIHANRDTALYALSESDFVVQVRRAFATYTKDHRPDTEPRQVYKDVNCHTCITVYVDLEVVQFIAMDSAGLDVKSMGRREFDDAYMLIEGYAIENAAMKYLEADWIACSDQAREFLSSIVPSTRSTIMASSIKTAATKPAKVPKAAKFADTKVVEAKKLAAKSLKIAKTAPVVSAEAGRRSPATVAGRRATDKKVASGTGAVVKAGKEPRVSAADRKAAQDALEAKQTIVLGKNAEGGVTECMREIAKALGKNAKGLTRGKIMERFSANQKPAIVKMNIGWGVKLGVFKVAA